MFTFCVSLTDGAKNRTATLNAFSYDHLRMRTDYYFGGSNWRVVAVKHVWQ